VKKLRSVMSRKAHHVCANFCLLNAVLLMLLHKTKEVLLSGVEVLE
jgi:hypothetical protein